MPRGEVRLRRLKPGVAAEVPTSVAAAIPMEPTATQENDNQLPVGTTVFYIQALTKRGPETEDQQFYQELRETYPRLYFSGDTAPSKPSYTLPTANASRYAFLNALAQACGATQPPSFLARLNPRRWFSVGKGTVEATSAELVPSEVLKPASAEALETMLILFLDDPRLLKLICGWPSSSLLTLRLDKHLKSPSFVNRNTAMELIALFTLSPSLSNYMEYILEDDNRVTVTRFLQEASKEIVIQRKQPSKAAAGSRSQSQAKRQKTERNSNLHESEREFHIDLEIGAVSEDEDEGDEDSEVLLGNQEGEERRGIKRLRSTEERLERQQRNKPFWMWASDAGTSTSSEQGWTRYDYSASSRIEAAFLRGQRTFKLTNQWFIDFVHLQQRRADDPAKRRPIRRVVPLPASSSSSSSSTSTSSS